MAKVEVHNFKLNDIDLNFIVDNAAQRVTVPAGKAPADATEQFQPGVAVVDEELLKVARKNNAAVEGLFADKALRVLKPTAKSETPAPAPEAPPAAPAAPAPAAPAAPEAPAQ